MNEITGRTIALLTDFGLQDSYVGVMKAVMRHICPTADFIDISHAIQPQNVREAALMLMGACAYFPAGTVFLVVVDPGVGTTRRPIAVETENYHFVAPDNGVLSYVLDSLKMKQVVELANPAYHLPSVSRTFHGRDVFAPGAAHLAAGVSIDMFGPVLADLQRFPPPHLAIGNGVITGEVIHIDHFGNVVTSIGACEWMDDKTLRLNPRFGGLKSTVEIDPVSAVMTIHGQSVSGIAQTYGKAERGDLLALVGSGGFVELAVNQGSGAARLKAALGDRVEMRI